MSSFPSVGSSGALLDEESDRQAISIQAIFGLNSEVRDNVFLTSDTSCIYPAGRCLVQFDLHSKQQRIQSPSFQHASRSDGITSMALMQSASDRKERKYFAVAERGENALIHIYESATLKRKRTLSSAITSDKAKEYVSLDFSSDGKVLALSGAPNFGLTLWNLEQKKVIASTDNISAADISRPYQSGMVLPRMTHCSFCPSDSSLLCVSGEGMLRFVRVETSGFRVLSASVLRDPRTVVAHAWLRGDDHPFIAATADGELILVQNGEYHAHIEYSDDPQKDRITSLHAFQKGFVAGMENGSVVFYDRSDGPEIYSRVRTTILPRGNRRNEDLFENYSNSVVSISINPELTKIAVSTRSRQIYIISLSDEGDHEVEFLSHTWHSDQVTGVDCCVRKNLIATCSADRSVRIWNYADRSLNIVQFFPEEASSIAMHPSGHQILVGFRTKLILMDILFDRLQEIKPLSVRECRECRFSHGGQYFAAINQHNVLVYTTHTCELVKSLRHLSFVQSLCWKKDDSALLSCSDDGSLFEWETREFEMIQDHSGPPNCKYSSAQYGPENSIYAVGADRPLKKNYFEIISGAVHSGSSSKQVKEFEIMNTRTPIHKLLFAPYNGHLFCAKEDGLIRFYPQPLEEDVFEDFVSHDGFVEAIAVSYDEQLLFSVGRDGCIIMYSVQSFHEKPRKLEIPISDETLISHADLESLQSSILTLEQTIDNLMQQHDVNMKTLRRQMQQEHEEDKMKLIQELEEISSRAKENEIRKDAEISRLKVELTSSERNHDEELNRKQNEYKEKVEALHRRIASLEEKITVTMNVSEARIRDLDEERQHELQMERETFNETLRENEIMIESLKSEIEYEQRRHAEEIDQIEEDSRKQLQRSEEKYELQLQQVKEELDQEKGAKTLETRKKENAEKQLEQLQNLLRWKEEELMDAIDKQKQFEREISKFKKELTDREKAGMEKERKNVELKKEKAELEKHKYVMEHRYQRLVSMVEPKDEEISAMKDEILNMNEELEKYVMENSALKTKNDDFRMKVQGARKENKRLQFQIRDFEITRRHFESDLHDLLTVIQDARVLKEKVREIHSRYVGEMVELGDEMEEGVKDEYARQREYLEKQVETLKKKLTKDMDTQRKENRRILQENITLIKEINDLRRENKALRSMSQQRGSQGEKSRAFFVTQQDGNGVLSDGPESGREIEMQKAEILRLRQRIVDLEDLLSSAGGGGMPSSSSSSSRAVSRERLPPIRGFDPTEEFEFQPK